MSTTKRLISGSVASWAGMAVTLLTQLALVPIFLTYWDVKVYGIWLAIQGVVTILATLDKGFNDYLLYEFLRFGPEGKDSITFMLWSAFIFLVLISIVETTIIYFLAFHLRLESFLAETGVDSYAMRDQMGWALLCQWGVWMLNNMAGLFFRALCAYGYYPRMGWWFVISSLVASVSSVVAVSMGANLATASASLLAGTFIVVLIQALDIRRLLKKEELTMAAISLNNGFSSYITSLGLSGRYFLENFRQQGVRLLLAPLSGAAGLTAFTTMRTGANVALQGLNTITNPIMPELMRFLREKQQSKTDAAFDTIWLVLVAVMTPGVLVLQVVTPSLFAVWTKGQVVFDPYLFATLSLTVLVYAWSQPATAVIVGNNLLRIQLIISAASSAIIVVGMLVLIPKLNILGAGVALLLAEIVAAIGFQYYARKWLNENGLRWPAKSAGLSCASVLTATVFMFLMTTLQNNQLGILCLGGLAVVWNLIAYWRNMPVIAVEKVYMVLAKLPGFSKIVENTSAKTIGTEEKLEDLNAEK